jgi:hypothetical protein
MLRAWRAGLGFWLGFNPYNGNIEASVNSEVGGEVIAIFGYDSDKKSIFIIKHRSQELTEKFYRKKVNGDWLIGFINNISGLDEAEKFGEYYVYLHIFPNNMLYGGKGSNNRAYEFESGRSERYKRILESSGPPMVCILEKFLSEALAYELENLLINELEKIFDPRNIINMSHGLEQSNILDMPPRSIQAAKIGTGNEFIIPNEFLEKNYVMLVDRPIVHGAIGYFSPSTSLYEIATWTGKSLRNVLDKIDSREGLSYSKPGDVFGKVWVVKKASYKDFGDPRFDKSD